MICPLDWAGRLVIAGRDSGRAVAEVGDRKRPHAFGTHGLGGGAVGHDCVENGIVNRREAGSSRVTEITSLDRGGFAGKNVEAIVAGVQCEVYENVDFVGLNKAEGLFCAQSADVAPSVGGGLVLRGELVTLPRGGVARNFKLIVIMVFQKRDKEEAYGVLPKVGRNVANAKFAVW